MAAVGGPSYVFEAVPRNPNQTVTSASSYVPEMADVVEGDDARAKNERLKRMMRGCVRHMRFQASLRLLTTVGVLREGKTIKGRGNNISKPVRAKLVELTGDCDPSTNLHVYTEVVANRSQQQSRRADAVIYVPGRCLVYIEYKTIEAHGVTGDDPNVHRKQLTETFGNLLANISCQMSLRFTRDQPHRTIPMHALLVSKRMWTGKRVGDEVVTQINDMGAVRRVREPLDDPNMMRSVLMALTPTSRRFRQQKTVRKLEQTRRRMNERDR